MKNMNLDISENFASELMDRFGQPFMDDNGHLMEYSGYQRAAKEIHSKSPGRRTLKDWKIPHLHWGKSFAISGKKCLQKTEHR
jgi:hypothetical protein